MSVSSIPVPPETRRFSIPFPRPLWILLATIVVVIAVGLQIASDGMREEESALRELERYWNAIVEREMCCSVLSFLPDSATRPFQRVTALYVGGERNTAPVNPEIAIMLPEIISAHVEVKDRTPEVARILVRFKHLKTLTFSRDSQYFYDTSYFEIGALQRALPGCFILGNYI